jgi:hypothetical protein
MNICYFDGNVKRKNVFVDRKGFVFFVNKYNPGMEWGMGRACVGPFENGFCPLALPILVYILERTQVRRRCIVFIRVMYGDGRFDMVRNDMLDILVANMKVKKIRRASGWVDLERDQIRQGLGATWEGPERRAPWPSR